VRPFEQSRDLRILVLVLFLSMAVLIAVIGIEDYVMERQRLEVRLCGEQLRRCAPTPVPHGGSGPAIQDARLR